MTLSVASLPSREPPSHSARSARRSSFDWRELVVSNESGDRVSLLARDQDAPGGQRTVHVVRARPALVCDIGGVPRLSVTFVLERQPRPGETGVADLVERATIGLDVTVAPAAWMLTAAAAQSAEARALFAREARFQMGTGDSLVAEATVTNGQLVASLSATVDRARALELLDALQGSSTGLSLSASLKYRGEPGPAISLVLVTDLARVYDRLARAAADERIFYERDLENYLAAMIDDGTVSLDGFATDSQMDSKSLAKASLESFVRAAALLVTALEDDERSPQLGRRYRLGGAPPASMPMRIRVATSSMAGALEELTARIPVHELLKGILTRPDSATLVHFVAVDQDGGGLAPLARHQVERPPRGPVAARPATLALHGNRITTLAAAVQPSAAAAAPAHTMIATHVMPPQAALVLAGATVVETRRNLPVLTEGASPPWPDRVDPNRRWYLPEVAPVVPAPTVDPETAPFLFTFRTTGHDLSGRPGLEASVRITVEKKIPADVETALSGLGAGVRGEPVVAGNLSMELEVPFRDENGHTNVERFRAVRVETGERTITGTFELLNDWARVAYGSLAQEGFQSQPARVTVAYTYEGYAPVASAFRLELLFGGKHVAAPIELRSGRARARDRGGIDRETGAVHLADGVEIKLPALGRKPRARRPLETAPLRIAASTKPSAALVALRPELTAPTHLVEALRRTEYAEVVRLRRETVDVLFPCNQLGALYLEERAGTDGELQRLSIGCRPALELGQTEHRLYEEVVLPSPLRSSGRVYRSLQSPGRFVHVPDSYRVTRYGPADGERAYRPSVLLYSTVDIEDLTKSRCVIVSTLEPSSSEADTLLLLDYLRRHEHTEARLELVTEVGGDVTFDWALPTGGGDLLRLDVASLRTPQGFEVTLATDAFGLPQLQEILAHSGISGTATLALSDGSRWVTTLRLHLARITGPRPGGPLTLDLSSSGRVTLRNRIESPVLVNELLLLDGADSLLGTARAEIRLEAGASASVDLETPPARCSPAYTVESTASSLVEIRSFVEDITLTVLLHNRIDLNAFSIARMTVEARIPGVEGIQRTDFESGSEVASSIQFLLPLTQYLASPSLELQVSLTDGSGAARQVGPLLWRLGIDGYIVSLTPDLLGLQ